MTFHQIVIEEVSRRGISEEVIRASLQRAVVNCGPDERDHKELTSEEAEKARKQIGDLIDLVKGMTPAQRILCRSILISRARARNVNN